MRDLATICRRWRAAFQRFSVVGRVLVGGRVRWRARLARWKARERIAGWERQEWMWIRCRSLGERVCDGENTVDMGPSRPVVRPVLNNYISGRADHTSETILEGTW